MSHCSKFDVKFRDKHSLFKAMRNLGMNPENQLWESYKTTLGKTIGLNGEIIGKLLTGYCDNMNLFFIEENGEFVLNMESHKLLPQQIKTEGDKIVKSLQNEYVKCALDKLQNDLIQTGQSARMQVETTEASTIYTLFIGGQGKKLVVSLDKFGVVFEQVQGFVGKSCADLTFVFEGCMTNEVRREWNAEQTEVLNGQKVQVLRLIDV